MSYLDYVYQIIKNSPVYGLATGNHNMQIYEEIIIHLVGISGFSVLKENGLLTKCRTVRGYKIWTLVDRGGESDENNI